MPLEAETHAVHTGMAMPPLAESAFRRSGICTREDRQEKSAQMAEFIGALKKYSCYLSFGVTGR